MSVLNPAELMAIFGANTADDTVFRAVVTSLDGNLVYIRRDGSITPEGGYSRAVGLLLAAGDEVIVAKVGTSYVVLARVVRADAPASAKKVYVPSTSMQPDGGSWAAANGSQGPYGIQEVDGATQGAFFSFRLPEDASAGQYPTYTVIYWVSAGSGGRGDLGLYFEHRYGKTPNNAALTNNVAYTKVARVYVAGSVYRDNLTAVGADPVGPGDEVWGNLLRLGADVNDTLVANIILLGIEVGYT